MKNKFTIIIPSRERASTLKFCLQTCVAQDYDNLEILVSDNFSTDHTKEVVESFNDPRIRYINTGKRLSMSANWEFALSHIKEGWVAFIGDDDGFLPGSISLANELLEKSDQDADVIYWYDKTPWYFWAGPFGGSGNDNNIVLSIIKDYSPFKGKDRLLKLASFLTSYECYPIIYHGFVHMELINRIKEKSSHGLFFQSCIPDVYSSIPLSLFSKGILNAPRPLSINGVSKNSTGGASLFKEEDIAVNKFISEPNIPFNPALNFENSAAIMADLDILISDSFLQFLDHVDFDFCESKKDIKEFILLNLLQSMQKKDAYKEIAAQFIAHNGLQHARLKDNKVYRYQHSGKKYFFYKYKYQIDCSKMNTVTIADIAARYPDALKVSTFEKIRHHAGHAFKIIKRYIRFVLNV